MEEITLELTVNKGLTGCNMFISPYVDHEQGHWYILEKLKVTPATKQ